MPGNLYLAQRVFCAWGYTRFHFSFSILIAHFAKKRRSGPVKRIARRSLKSDHRFITSKPAIEKWPKTLASTGEISLCWHG